MCVCEISVLNYPCSATLLILCKFYVFFTFYRRNVSSKSEKIS